MKVLIIILTIVFSVHVHSQLSWANSPRSSDQEVQASVDHYLALYNIKTISYLERQEYQALINHLETLVKDFNNDIAKELPLTWELYSLYNARKGLAKELSQFITEYPDSYIPYLLSGTYYTGQGWTHRGGSYISETDQKNINGMDYYHAKAFPDINKAIQLNPDFMHSYLIRAAIYRPRRAYAQAMWDDFNMALKLRPVSFDAWTEYLKGSMPRWYGTEELLVERLLESQKLLDKNPRLSGMKAFVARNEAEKYWYAKQLDAAVKLYIGADSLGDHPWVTGEVARVLLDTVTDNDQACEYVDKAIKLEPYEWRTNRFAIYCEHNRKLGFIK